MATTLLELDERRRASFGRIGRKQDTRYVVQELDNGELLLSPAVVMTERDAALLANPKLVEQIKAGIAEAEAGLTTRVDLDALEAEIEPE